MNTAMSTLSKLFSPRRREAVVPDPADMGTCFGMEMSLQRDAGPLESERAAAADPAGPAEADPVAEKRRWRPWASRADRKAPLAA